MSETDNYEPPEFMLAGEFNEDTLSGGGGAWDSFWLLP
jgi:hypothetical protein